MAVINEVMINKTSSASKINFATNNLFKMIKFRWLSGFLLRIISI